MPKGTKHNHMEDGPQTSCDLEWATSTCSEEDLNGLVIEGILPDQETIGWLPAAGEELPTPHTHELIIFEA